MTLKLTKRDQIIKKCLEATFKMRRSVLQMSLAAGTAGAHLGGSFSMIEILSVLYFDIMRYDIKNPFWDERDRLILSKGHGAPGLYAALSIAGFIDADDLITFKSDDTYLSGHPSMNIKKGIEFSSGSLGHGLSLGVGSALALRRRLNETARVFVLLGDGELNEGSVWEAAMSAAHFGLKNLVAIVDKNGLQQDGSTEQIMDLGNLADKWASFGWKVREIDGHDLAALHDCFQAPASGPLAIIAHTTKGKGASFVENKRAWHHSRLTQAMFDQAMTELAVAERDALQ